MLWSSWRSELTVHSRTVICSSECRYKWVQACVQNSNSIVISKIRRPLLPADWLDQSEKPSGLVCTVPKDATASGSPAWAASSQSHDLPSWRPLLLPQPSIQLSLLASTYAKEPSYKYASLSFLQDWARADCSRTPIIIPFHGYIRFGFVQKPKRSSRRAWWSHFCSCCDKDAVTYTFRGRGTDENSSKIGQLAVCLLQEAMYIIRICFQYH